MPGRKDKKPRSKEGAARGEGGKKGGDGGLASMLGFGVNPGDVDDADLEAELLALQGKSPGKKGKSTKGMMSLGDVDKMMAGLDQIGDDDDDDDDDDDEDDDDDDLLGELQALEEMDDDITSEDVVTPPNRSPAPTAPRKSGGETKVSPSKSMGVEGGDVRAVSERLSLYQQGLQQAKAAGESSKARRYKRSLESLEKMLKNAKAGRPVNLEDLPPPVFIKEDQASSAKETTPTVDKPRPPPPQVKPSPTPPPNLINLDDPEFDEFNFSEEELASLATSIKDDRNQSQSQSAAGVPQAHSGTSMAVKSDSGPSPHQPPAKSPVNRMETSPSVQAKPVPKPRPKPQPPPITSGGLIDLDDPEFDEFNLTEEDIEAMAASMVDDRYTKKPKLEEPVPSYPPPPPVSRSPVAAASRSPSSSKSPQNPPPLVHPLATPPADPTKSLPANLTEPVSRESDKSSLRAMLAERKEQYLAAAKEMKEPSKVREYKLIAAKFARVIKAVDAGGPLDLNLMPGPPPGYVSQFHMDVAKFSISSSTTQGKPTATPPEQGQNSTDGDSKASVQEPDTPPNPEIPVPKTALEALEQRLAKYKEGQKSAMEKGESSKGRRMGRIVKQYEAAIRDTRTGKPHDFDELPAPPGYPPIPASSSGPVRPSVPLPTQSLPPSHNKVPPSPGTAGGRAAVPSISQSQVAFIEQRMLELKTAARQEQAKGDKEKALHYVKMMKGLETMLKAANCGLPVNLEQVPPSPFADLSKTMPSADVMSHLRPAEEKDAATFELIIKQLEKQVDICQRNAATNKKIGSNASAIEYENMSQNCEKELLALKGIQTQGYGPPKFSLELRKLTIVHSNTHLSSGVCEVEVTRVINLTCPPKYEEKDMNIYVEVEFPYPVESPPKKSTECVHKMCSPEFKDQPLVFDIDRKHHRSMLRAFKRTPLKCTLWQRRTLKKDVYLGQVGVQLEFLEGKSEVHCVLELLDERGRKPVGGKMEIFVRLREPITGRDVEQCEEQWLVFKEPIAAKSVTPMPKPTAAAKKQVGATTSATTPNYALLSPVKVENTISVAALKLEFSLVTSALKGGHKDGHTVQRGRLIKARMDSIQQKLQTDPKFRKAYPMLVVNEMQGEKQLEAQLVKQGKAKQAEVVILQKRRAAIEKELLELKHK